MKMQLPIHMHGGNGKVAYIDTEGTLYLWNCMSNLSSLFSHHIYINCYFLQTISLMKFSADLNALCQLLRDLGWMPMLFLTMYEFHAVNTSTFLISANPFHD